MISFDLPILRLCLRPSAAVHEGCRSAFPVFGQTENILIEEIFFMQRFKSLQPWMGTAAGLSALVLGLCLG